MYVRHVYFPFEQARVQLVSTFFVYNLFKEKLNKILVYPSKTQKNFKQTKNAGGQKLIDSIACLL